MFDAKVVAGWVKSSDRFPRQATNQPLNWCVGVPAQPLLTSF